MRCGTWITVVVVWEKGVLRMSGEGSGWGRVRKKRMVKVLKSERVGQGRTALIEAQMEMGTG
jgi:hypothetical protein